MLDFIRFCYIIICSENFNKCFKNKIVDYSEKNNNNIYNYGRNNNYNENDKSGPIMINGNIYTECAICYDVTALKKIKAIYPCGHRLFCEKCIKNINNKCPTCNSKIHSFINIYENLNDEQSELINPENKNNM
jgi:hypothetical protein